MGTWPVFWFETNSAWGLVDSPAAWAKMRANWNEGGHGLGEDEIYSAKSTASTDSGEAIPEFGTRAEHLCGKMTLGEFFDQNGVDRSTGHNA